MPFRRRPPVLLTCAALVSLGLALAAAYVTLPERARVLDARGWPRRLAATVARGAYHVHTRRSDGSGSLDEVAEAAGRAGLDFVIVTDHGDGTRPPEPPRYRSGVLCLDAVEISTTGGHYVALGLPATPYPFGGEPRDVVEDVRRMGGLGIVAHPDSAKRSLAWQAWDLDLDGLEWTNADSEWRDESRGSLMRTLLSYPFRPAESVVALFDRPAVTIDRWDTAAGKGLRRIALGGLDAHARFGWQGLPVENGEGDEPGSQLSLEVPSYRAMFRAMTTRVELERPLTGDAPTDGAALLQAIRRGRVFTVVDGLARGGAMEFFAETPSGVARMGDLLPPSDGTARLHARTLAPAGSRLLLLANGKVVASSTGVSLSYDAPLRPAEPVAYRVEVARERAGTSASDLWIVGNAIGTGYPGPAGRALERHPRLAGHEAAGPAILSWTLEKDPGTSGAVQTDGRAARLALDFTLAAGHKDTWAAAVAALAGGMGPDDQLQFRAWASRPLRLSVQLRAPQGTEGQRWRRSVYLDATPREVVVPARDLTPVGRGPVTTRLSRADSLLFVIDRTHTEAGASGRVIVENVRLVRGGGPG